MFKLTRSAICALYPGSDRLPGVEELGIDEYLERYRREATPLMRAGLVVGTAVFTLSPPVTIGVPLPSFLLPKRTLDRHARKATTHPWYFLRQPIFVLKMVGGMCWGEHERVRALYNLDPYPPDPDTRRTE